MSTTPEQWKHIEDVLDEALDLPPEARAAYLDQACPDPVLRARVEQLLAADAQAGAFLDEPAHAYASPLLDALDETHENETEPNAIGHHIAA